MKTRPQRLVIVDGCSTGGELIRELVERNVEYLHLQSEPAVSADLGEPSLAGLDQRSALCGLTRKTALQVAL